MHKEAVAEILRGLRGRAGLSQAQLGRKLRHSATWVSKIERSERGIDVPEVVRWARACGFDAELVTRESGGDAPLAVHQLSGEYATDPLVTRLVALVPRLGDRERILLESVADVLERLVGR